MKNILSDAIWQVGFLAVDLIELRPGPRDEENAPPVTVPPVGATNRSRIKINWQFTRRKARKKFAYRRPYSRRSET
jgi:hypothetical protein